MGKRNEAIVRASQFSSLSHLELDRTRLVVQYLLDQDRDKVFAQNNSPVKHRCSIHQMPALSFEEWVNKVILMLTACNQKKYAALLSNLFTQQEKGLLSNNEKASHQEKVLNKYLLKTWIYSTERINSLFKTLHIPETEACPPSIFLSDYITRIARYWKLNLVYHGYFD